MCSFLRFRSLPFLHIATRFITTRLIITYTSVSGTTCGGYSLEVANATAMNHTKPFSSGESITFVCHEGFKFPDMETEKTSNCTDDGWVPKTLASCAGMMVFLRY